MGDRANVCISDNDSKVFLYTHWKGYDLPEIVRKALSKNERWDDPQYLSRIIFQQMIGDDQGTTGFGISAKIGDGGDKLIIVDCINQCIKIKDKSLSFTEYVKLQKANWE